MSPDSRKQMKELTSLAQESIMLSKKALELALGNNISTSVSAQFRHTTYATLYKNCGVQLISTTCPAYVVASTAVPADFFSVDSNIQLRGDKENGVQKFGNIQFRNFQQQMNLVHHDTHKVPFFANGDQPDIVFCPPNFVANQMVAVSALKWKRYPEQETVAFDSEEKGQAISYAQLILDAQKWRSHALVCICNLECFQCFEAKRLDGELRAYEYQAVRFGALGRNILWGIVTASADSLGFVIEGSSMPC